jgi:AraC-like DNA-binding protein
MERRRRALLSERALREQLLRRIAQLEYTPGDEEDVRRFLRLDPSQGGTAVALQPLPDSMGEWSAHKALLLASIQNCISQAMRERNHGWCFCGGEGDVLLLYGPQTDTPALAEEMRQLVEAEYGLSVRMGVSAPAPNLGGLGAAFAQARASIAAGAANCPDSAMLERPLGASGYVVRAALRVIRERYMEDISVTALAEDLHISPNYFSRVFKRAMGMGCNEYITGTRIRAAKERLANTDMRCYEIAEAIGYHDTNYFSLAFKKNTGMSPEQYRIAVHGGGRRISDFN